MASINCEEIFSEDEIDINSISSFVQTRNDMKFPIVVDSERTAVRGEWCREDEHYSPFFRCGSPSSNSLLQSCSIKQGEGLYLPVSPSPFSWVFLPPPGPFDYSHMSHPPYFHYCCRFPLTRLLGPPFCAVALSGGTRRGFRIFSLTCSLIFIFPFSLFFFYLDAAVTDQTCIVDKSKL